MLELQPNKNCSLKQQRYQSNTSNSSRDSSSNGAAYLMYHPDPLLRILSTTPLPAALHVKSLLTYLLHYLLFKLRKVTCLMIPMHSAVVSHTTPPILYSAVIWPEQPPRCREPASPMECFRCMPTAASLAVMNPLPERDRCGRAAS